MNNPILTFTPRELKPMWGDDRSKPMGVRLSSNLRYLAGTFLAVLTSTAVNAVQRFTGTAAAGETYLEYPGWGVSTTKIGALATAAEIKACLETIPPLKGNISASGGPLGSGTVDITFINALAGLPQTTIILYGSSLSGGTISIASQTTGVANDRWVQADLTKVATPAAAVTTYSGTGAGGTWLAGTYIIQHTWETLSGETLASPPTHLTLTASQSLRVAAINAAGTPDEAVYFNVYVNGARVAQIAVTTPGTAGNVAQTDIAGPGGSDGKGIPQASTAYTYNDGRQTPRAILRWDVTTTPGGYSVRGSYAGGQHGTATEEITAWLGGYFLASELVGLSAEILTLMGGRIIKGALSDPANCVVYFPS